MNINISLNQGKKFNQYQKEIKYSIEKEGHFTKTPRRRKGKQVENFENIFQTYDQNMASANQQNTADLQERDSLVSQFNLLSAEYRGLEQIAKAATEDILARTSDQNPYRGQNICLNNGSGACGYVTDLGQFKWYPADNNLTYDATAGKNGCPATDYMNIDARGDGEIPGSIINSRPTLLVGNNMVSGQSCGNEGKNVLVNKLVNDVTASYLGCFNGTNGNTGALSSSDLAMNYIDESYVTKQTDATYKEDYLVPIMKSDNQDGFVASVSSYQGSNYAWKAFNRSKSDNINTPTTGYDGKSGKYKGSYQPGNGGFQGIKGEWLRINFPAGNTSVVSSYNIQTLKNNIWRAPNTFYVLGLLNGQWVQLDYQENQVFANDELRSYPLTNNTTSYSSYCILVPVVGSPDLSTKPSDEEGRASFAINEWNLMGQVVDSPASSTEVLDISALKYHSYDDCKQSAAENGYPYFALQNRQSDDTGYCLVSKDLTTAQQFGYPPNFKSVVLWQSNTNNPDTVATPAATGEVTFYVDCGFSGTSKTFGVGTYSSWLQKDGYVYDTTIPDNTLSSVKVPDGMMVTIYQDDIGSNHIVFGPGEYSCLTDYNFNDTQSVWIVEAYNKVIFYKDSNYNGTSASFGVGTYTALSDRSPSYTIDATIPDNSLSSVRVPPGLRVNIYADDIGSKSISLAPGDYPDLNVFGMNDVQTVWVVEPLPNDNYVKMNNTQMQILSSLDDSVILSLPDSADPACLGLNMDDLVATYGGNCPSSYNVQPNNVMQKVLDLYKAAGSPLGQFALATNNGVLGDPAKGCQKGWDTSYKCNDNIVSKSVGYTENQTFIYDCSAETKGCNFLLELTDDGNMRVVKCDNVNDPTTYQEVWSSGTTTTESQILNPDWEASKGKYGKNILTLGQTLQIGEWIGSLTGTVMLKMEQDGNLVLYGAQPFSACNAGTNGKMFGQEWINAVYQLDKAGDPGLMGKVGFIDGDAKLHEYPSSMLGQSTNYSMFKNKNAPGNDLTGMPLTDSTLESCQTACNDNADCYGYIFDKNVNNCWLKDKNVQSALTNFQGNTTVEQPVCNNVTTKYTLLSDVDYPGNDLSYTANYTADQCKADCDNNNDCEGFAFKTTTNECWLKNRNMDVSNQVSYTGMESYFKEKNNYSMIDNVNIPDNTIETDDHFTVQGCKTMCDNNPDCAGFVFDNNSMHCYRKNSNMKTSSQVSSSGWQSYFKEPLTQEPCATGSTTYPIQNAPDMDFYLRNPSVCTSTGKCSSDDIVNIDSVRYAAYVKGGDMGQGENFNPTLPPKKITDRLIALEKQLGELGQQISDKLNSFEIEKTSLDKDITSGQTDVSKDLDKYNKIKKEIDFLLKSDPNYNRTDHLDKTIKLNFKQSNSKQQIPSDAINANTQKKNKFSINSSDYMQTVETMLNMQDLEAMVNDSDLIVIQQNSQYMLWTLLAIGIMIITINTLKK